METQKLIEIAVEAAIDAGNEIIKIYNTHDFGIEKKADNSPLTIADKKANQVIVNYLEKTELPILSEEGRDIPFEERSQWGRFWLVDPLDGTKEFIKRNGEFTVNIALIEDGKPIAGVVYAPVLQQLYFSVGENTAYRIDDISLANFEKFNNKDNCKQLPTGKKSNDFLVVASRSHLNDDTLNFVETLKKKHGEINFVSKGSSLKLCLIAEGSADIYPRYAPTMEWDTAAGHAVVVNSGGTVKIADSSEDLQYNKQNLLNPYFIATASHLK